MSLPLRAWEEPFNVSASNPPELNTAGLNAAFEAAYLNGMAVDLPAGRIETTGGLLIKDGMHVTGRGTKHTYGTHLVMVAGSNRDHMTLGETGFDASGAVKMWHGGLVENFRLEIAPGNDLGNNITINRFGETAEIRRIMCLGAPEYNFNSVSTCAPARITHCSGMVAGLGNLRIVGAGAGAFTIDELSGDKNGTFIYVDGQVTILAKGLKAEGPHRYLFDIPNTLMSVTVLGGYANHWVTGPGALFRIRAGGTSTRRPEINAIGLFQSRYENIIEDEFSLVTVPTKSQCVSALHYTGA